MAASRKTRQAIRPRLRRKARARGKTAEVPLKQQLAEALQRQTATAEILKVIASSPSDVQPVFEAIVRTGVRLFKEAAVAVVRPDGGQVRLMAIAESDPGRAAKWAGRFPFPLDREYIQSAAILDCAMVEVADALAVQEKFVEGRRHFALSGYRAMSVAPMMRDGAAIGAISVVRLAPGPLSERQNALLRTFADQAVIAIENVRLFNETKEALEQQTATSEILRIISSSPSELMPVFKAILANATSLCEAAYGVFWLREGDAFRMAALHGALPAEQWRTGMTVRPSPDVPLARVVTSGKSVHIVDMREDAGYRSGAPLPVAAVEVAGMRTLLLVPMMKENEVIGEVAMYRTEVRAFTERQIALIGNFANQAVIAIENVRLFNETKALNEERMARLKSFFSPQLAELLAAGKGDDLLKTHRREITVQFFDLRGFTAFTGAAEPEEVMELLSDFHGALGKLVMEHEGTIERFAGDSVMVFFNDPLPVERPAEQAMRAAIAMMRAFEPIAALWKKRGHDLGLGAGIAQGFATLGAIGFEGRRDYAAIGPVTNLAARLCAEAKGGQILADRKTVAALEGSFEFDPVGDLQLKGFSQTVPAFALRGA
ncbi:MAG TPA: adenylate/guanylate cyclase domain-containing protein [Burkholderiales bacterium]|jgi:class 3 adenylate cyclase